MKTLPFQRASKRIGFTLVELMISLLAGSLVIAAAWRMSRMSSEMFNEQSQRVDTDSALHHASEVLRSAITRAGYLSFRTMNEVNNCLGAPAAPFDQPAITVALDANGQHVLYVTGDFTTSQQYKTIGAQTNVLRLDASLNVFRMAFINPATLALDNAEFVRAFVVNPANLNGLPQRWLSVTYRNNVFVHPMVSMTTALGPNPQITLLNPLPQCVVNGNEVLVAPISTYRFMLESVNADAELARLANATVFVGGAPTAQVNQPAPQRFVFVRREIDMNTRNAAVPTPIPGTAQVVLDFAQSFRIAAVVSDRNTPPTLTLNPTPDTVPVAQQDTFRSLLIDLVANGPEVQGQQDRPEQLRARRRVAHFEVFMPNMSHPAGILP